MMLLQMNPSEHGDDLLCQRATRSQRHDPAPHQLAIGVLEQPISLLAIPRTASRHSMVVMCFRTHSTASHTALRQRKPNAFSPIFPMATPLIRSRQRRSLAARTSRQRCRSSVQRWSVMEIGVSSPMMKAQSIASWQSSSSVLKICSKVWSGSVPKIEMLGVDTKVHPQHFIFCKVQETRSRKVSNKKCSPVQITPHLHPRNSVG